MGQGIRASQRVQTTTGLRVDPKVVLNSQIMQYTIQELDQAIEAELADNPALERLHDDSEPLSEEIILRTVAPQELGPSSEDFEFLRSIPSDDGDRVDWIDFAAATTTLWDHLRAQLLPMLPESLRSVGEYAIECVNEGGYLNSPVEEIALENNCSLADAETVVHALKECEPTGVGASDVKECLLLQLRDADTLERKLARAILKTHMDDFIARRTSRIARRYRIVTELVEAAFDEILALTPYPGEAFRVATTHQSKCRPVGVIPDLVLLHTEAGWEVHVRGSDPATLGVDRAYQTRQRQLEAMKRPPKGEMRHVSEYVNRASRFIESIQQRRRTMKAIGEYLVLHQNGFVSTGRYEFLKPLTRSKMAKDLGVHESTVSRATMSKFVQIANGELVAFEVFFKPALRAQKMIAEILATENPDNPLSDEQIAALLKKKGVTVARRTVNKYRDRGKLLSSRKRRSA